MSWCREKPNFIVRDSNLDYKVESCQRDHRVQLGPMNLNPAQNNSKQESQRDRVSRVNTRTKYHLLFPQIICECSIQKPSSKKGINHKKNSMTLSSYKQLIKSLHLLVEVQTFHTFFFLFSQCQRQYLLPVHVITVTTERETVTLKLAQLCRALPTLSLKTEQTDRLAVGFSLQYRRAFFTSG